MAVTTIRPDGGTAAMNRGEQLPTSKATDADAAPAAVMADDPKGATTSTATADARAGADEASSGKQTTKAKRRAARDEAALQGRNPDAAHLDRIDDGKKQRLRESRHEMWKEIRAARKHAPKDDHEKIERRLRADYYAKHHVVVDDRGVPWSASYDRSKGELRLERRNEQADGATPGATRDRQRIRRDDDTKQRTTTLNERIPGGTRATRTTRTFDGDRPTMTQVTKTTDRSVPKQYREHTVEMDQRDGEGKPLLHSVRSTKTHAGGRETIDLDATRYSNGVPARHHTRAETRDGDDIAVRDQVTELAPDGSKISATDLIEEQSGPGGSERTYRSEQLLQYKEGREHVLRITATERTPDLKLNVVTLMNYSYLENGDRAGTTADTIRTEERRQEDGSWVRSEKRNDATLDGAGNQVDSTTTVNGAPSWQDLEHGGL